MRILLFSHESMFPNFGGNREYLNEFINQLTSDGNECTVISWGNEGDYTFNQNNLHIKHFGSISGSRMNSSRLFGVNSSTSISYLASRIGYSQFFALNNTSPDKEMEGIVNKLKGYDLVLKNGPNASSLPLKASTRLGIPLIDRLDWFGLPRILHNEREWFLYLGEKVYFERFLNSLMPIIDNQIKKKELRTISGNYVYVPSSLDCSKLKKMSPEIDVEYVFPFLNEVHTQENDNNQDSRIYCLYFASKTISSTFSLKFLHKIAFNNTNLNITIAGNFGEFASEYSRTNFKILGKLEQDLFIEHLSRAMFVVFPTLEGHGVQMRLIRALSVGKAIIATSIICSSFTGLVDGKNIIIRDNPVEFEKAMINLQSDESLRNRISKGAKEYFLAELNGKKGMNKFYAMVDKILQ